MRFSFKLFLLFTLTIPAALWGQIRQDSLFIPETSDSAGMQLKTGIMDTVLAMTPAWQDTFRLSVSDSVIMKTDYDHFGDILSLWPGLFVADLGSVGQPVFASFLPAPQPLLLLRIEHIPILDPETNQVDWSWVPVEAVARVQTNASLFAANIIQIDQQHFSGAQTESKIVFRTGSNDYDDFDASIGMRLSEKRTLTLGGLIKNYQGLPTFNKYDAVKGRASLSYRITPGWDATTLFYLNRHELQQLLPAFAALKPPATLPSEKVLRYDYGLVLNGQLFARDRKDFQVVAHHTRLNREFHDWPLERFWENHLDISGLELGVTQPYRRLNHTIAASVRRLAIASPELGDHVEWHFTASLQTIIPIVRRLYFQGTMATEKYGSFKVTVLPTALFYVPVHSHTLVQFGSQISRFYPSFRQRFQNTGIVKGNPTLQPGEFYENFIALQRLAPGQFLVKFSHAVVKNQILPSQETLANTRYFNQQKSQVLATTVDSYLPVTSWIKIGGHGSYIRILEKSARRHYPDFFANGFIEAQRNLFQNSLDLNVRFGLHLWGPRPAGPGEDLAPVLVPSVRITGRIGLATVFFSLHNIADSQYDLIFGYPMRNLSIRWGVVWKFID